MKTFRKSSRVYLIEVQCRQVQSEDASLHISHLPGSCTLLHKGLQHAGEEGCRNSRLTCS